MLIHIELRVWTLHLELDRDQPATAYQHSAYTGFVPPDPPTTTDHGQARQRPEPAQLIARGEGGLREPTSRAGSDFQPS